MLSCVRTTGIVIKSANLCDLVILENMSFFKTRGGIIFRTAPVRPPPVQRLVFLCLCAGCPRLRCNANVSPSMLAQRHLSS